MNETLTRIWVTFTARQDRSPAAEDAGYEPDDVETSWVSTKFDAEAFRRECQKILDSGTVNYDLGPGRFLSATLGAEFTTGTDAPWRIVLCEWTPEGGWVTSDAPPPAEVVLAAHHRPSTAFEVAAYGELLLGLHATAPDHRCPAWCADCADDEGTGDCDTASALTEIDAL